MPSKAKIPAGYRAEGRTSIFVVALLGEVLQGQFLKEFWPWRGVAVLFRKKLLQVQCGAMDVDIHCVRVCRFTRCLLLCTMMCRWAILRMERFGDHDYGARQLQ